jgi:hypothetical protein
MSKGMNGIAAQVQAEVSALQDFQLDDIIALGAPTEDERELLGDRFDYFIALYPAALKEQKRRQVLQTATK